MSLISLDDEAQKLAEELVAITGESLAVAVTEALRERLATLGRIGLADKLMTIGRECAAALNASGGKMMEAEDLYDEKTGLPK